MNEQKFIQNNKSDRSFKTFFMQSLQKTSTENLFYKVLELIGVNSSSKPPSSSLISPQNELGSSETAEGTFYSHFQASFGAGILEFKENHISEIGITDVSKTRKELEVAKQKIDYQIQLLETERQKIADAIEKAIKIENQFADLDTTQSTAEQLAEQPKLKPSDSGVALNLKCSWTSQIPNKNPISMAVSWKTSRAALVEDCLSIWDLNSGSAIMSLPVSNATAVDFVNLNTCAVGSRDGNVTIIPLDYSADYESCSGMYKSCVHVVKSLPNSSSFLVGSDDGIVSLWDCNVTDAPLAEFSRLNFSLNDNRIDPSSLSVPSSIKVFDSSVWDQEDALSNSREFCSVTAAAADPQNPCIVAVGYSDGCIWVWDTRQPSDTRPIADPLWTKDMSSIRCLSFEASKTIHSGSDSGALRAWDWSNEIVTQTVQFDAPVTSVSLCDSSLFIASKYLYHFKNSSLRIVDSSNVKFVDSYEGSFIYVNDSNEFILNSL